MSERRLVTVRTVDRIERIADADAIELAVFGGWRVVVAKGAFAPGDPAVYFEVDSALPLADPRFTFLAPRGRRTIDDREYHVLRTIKLRGVISQGLVLPIAQVPEADGAADLTEALGVRRYEPPLPTEIASTALGPYPTVLARKTDAERVQNLAGVYPTLDPDDWYATEKLDGTSTTFITTSDGLRVCGRNYEWKPLPSLTSMRFAEREGLRDAVPPGFVMQGELFGAGIQDDRLGIGRADYAVFAVWRDGAQLPRSGWPDWARARSVPVHPDLRLPGTVDLAVAQADGVESLRAPGRKAEGLVWHRYDARPMPALDDRPCFKVVSNSWLLGSSKRRRR